MFYKWLCIVLLSTLVGCAGSVRCERVMYASSAPMQQPYMYQRPIYASPCGMRPCPVPYYQGYRRPAPVYGPYGYSAAMTARVTPHVYMVPSQPQRSMPAPHRVVVVHPVRRAR